MELQADWLTIVGYILSGVLVFASGFLAGRAWEHCRLKEVALNGRWDLVSEEEKVDQEKEYHCTEEAPDFRAEIHDGARVYEELPGMRKMVCSYCGVKWEEGR